MNESILLRLKPKLEVILYESDFEVIDRDDIQNEGIYSYHSIESLELKKEKTNWLVTILNSIFGLLMESGFFEKYNDKAYLKFHLKDTVLKLWLIKADIDKAEILKNELNRKLLRNNQLRKISK